jgi:hypothetical protein
MNGITLFHMIETNVVKNWAEEHGARGSRRVDCKGRMVMRPSDREIASQRDNIIPYDRARSTPSS